MAEDASAGIAVAPPSDPLGDDGMKLRIGEALGLKDFGDVKKNQHQVERLIEWAQMKGAKDQQDVIWNIKQLANRVGSSPFGTNMAKHLSQYAYLEMERLRLDKQLREMEA